MEQRLHQPLRMHYLQNIFKMLVCVFIGCSFLNASIVGQKASLSPSEAAQRIDDIVNKQYQKKAIKANPLTDDATFMRRVYLDIIGRIPTYTEAIRFLESKATDKRGQLIQELLGSEGYVSHQFNYWADLLRLKSRTKNNGGGDAYAYWIKENLRENKPYDTMVAEMLLAEGYAWEDYATGYYMRDYGMPLDNAANTAQIFLGTQMQCAQCHDHPFDKWKQKEFYQFAAYTYPTNTRINQRRSELFTQVRKMIQKSSLTDKEKGQVRQSTNRILRPLQYKVNVTGRKLKLPDDYQYTDAAPRDVVDPHSIMGEAIIPGPGQSQREAFVTWMISPNNPRFTKVIANRMWKKLLGVGVFEPVDDLRDNTEASNPELMQFLEEQMVALDYDLLAFQQMILNTQTYQRTASTYNAELDLEYHFPGPILRRMTAEQIWDSILSIRTADIDKQKAQPAFEQPFARAQQLLAMDPYCIAHMSRDMVETMQAQSKTQDKLRQGIKAAKMAGETAELKKLNQQMRRLNVERRKKLNEVTEKYAAMSMEGGSMEMSMEAMQPTENKRQNKKNRSMLRASELSAPTSPGHPLQQFGQSNRETIEGASQVAAITHALNFLNGNWHYQLNNGSSSFTKNYNKAKTPHEKLDVLFVTFLGRFPDAEERDIMLPIFKKTNVNKAKTKIAWALLNTRQFMFIE